MGNRAAAGQNRDARGNIECRTSSGPVYDHTITSDALIWVLQQVIDRAHAHGIKVVGCTLTPYEGAGYARANGEVIRDTVNRWIRSSGAFDAVVDFEAATRDPNNPKRFRPEFDPGDHLHPNDAGYKAMADAIDLSIFNPKRKK